MAMIKKLLFTLSLCMLVMGVLHAQSTIKGVVKDSGGTPVSYVQILLKQDGKTVNGANTDDNGSYQIYGVFAGTYDISAGGSMNCPSVHTQTGIYVSSSEVKFVDLTVDCSNELEEVIVIWEPPTFDKDNTVTTIKLTAEEVRRNPGRSINSALANLEGVATVDGAIVSVRGNRSDGQQTIIDGVRVRGGGGIPMQSVEGVELIQGGIPAEFGDGTSFTVITTRGVSKDFHGGIELRSSLEGYWQSLASITLSGPILKGKTANDPARMGFLFTVEGTYDKDASPARGGTWVAKPEVIEDIIANPIEYRYSAGTYYSYHRANDLEKDAFQKVRVRQNAHDWGFVAQGKIDIMGGGKDERGKPRNNLRFTLNGTYQYDQWLGWGRSIALFNSKNNGVTTNNTLRLNARINHRVKTDTSAKAILKNIMYDINVSYTLSNGKSMDRNHKDNLFAYGYVGKMATERHDSYEYDLMRVRDDREILDPHGIPIDTIVEVDVPFIKFDKPQAAYWTTFDPSAYGIYNPDLVPYTQNFVDWIQEKTGIDINDPYITETERRRVFQFFGNPSFTTTQYMQYSALLNGLSGLNTVGNGLFVPPGWINSGYAKSRSEAIGAKASLSLNIKDHEVKFGFELEKLKNRNYSIAAEGLWDLMRQITWDEGNFPLDYQASYWKYGDPNDPLKPLIGYTPGGDIMILDTLMYPTLINLKNFDLNFRDKFGIPKDQVVYVDVDSYNPSDLSLDLFSNYELLNGGFSYVTYSGYDYLGNRSNKKINLDNFFSGIDPDTQNPNLHDKDKYTIGAFEPIYMAWYLQDKFSISNLLFNVGLRLDYLNSNQYVLKDPFLLRDAYAVKDLKNSADWDGFQFPDNVNDAWIPYVGESNTMIADAPHSIVAYRDGIKWYDNLGQEIADPTSYLGAGGPILIEKRITGDPSLASSNAFTKYKPQLSVMPRISFSFPVSTNSLFYAHYDIITYRPSQWQMNPIAYLFINNYQSANRIISNPNLRAQRTVDYEIGFRQKVGENAALNIAAYYKEVRDQIQSYRFTGAYPNTYYSYYNHDFGTVQGYVLGMTMRGNKNISFNASYTLSFAKGTGSSAGSNVALIASGQPNLRTLTNLSYDQRHKIGATVFFSFDQGVSYNGPKTIKLKKGTETTKEIRWLENTGATLVVTAASGMPYSRARDVYSALGWGENTKPILKGSINGANMPWSFECNLRLEKMFMLNLAGKNSKTESGKSKKKPGYLAISLDFQNLLNIKNVISVYDYTGNPTDDGFLSSQLFENYLMSATLPAAAAENYYYMMVTNPYNYTPPFRVYLGISFSF